MSGSTLSSMHDARDVFLDAMQKRTAEVAIGASTLRNAGASGTVAAARFRLARLDLDRFVVQSAEEFTVELARATERVRRGLPAGADCWGTARKALNIFLRDVLYNTYLSRSFGFRRIEQWLELPLDSYTARALRADEFGASLPRWPGVVKLDWRTSASYQSAAEEIARSCRLGRVHLDIFWWRS